MTKISEIESAAKAAAQTYFDEFGSEPICRPGTIVCDWDSQAYQMDATDWPDSAWPLYRHVLHNEVHRLQQQLHVEPIGSGWFEAADGTTIYAP